MMAAQVADYKKVLEELYDRVGETDQLLIQKTLQKVGPLSFQE